LPLQLDTIAIWIAGRRREVPQLWDRGSGRARFKIPEKFLPVAGTESSRNRNFDRNFDFVPVISLVFKVINVK
jgi:hypothetical protein